MSSIARVHARQIFDSRGNPTVEVLWAALWSQRPAQPSSTDALKAKSPGNTGLHVMGAAGFEPATSRV
jgi:hypothetical protein